MPAELEISSSEFLARFIRASESIIQNSQKLSELDMVGDADFGVNVSSGFEKILGKLKTLPNPDIGLILRTAGEVFVFEIGSTIGGFLGRAFQAAGKQLEGKPVLNSTDFAGSLETMLATIQKVGGAKAGDKTLIDALEPAVHAAKNAAASGNAGVQEALEQAARAAEQGAQNTAQMVSKIGRASYIGERSRGSVDPGAMLIALFLKGLSGQDPDTGAHLT